MVLPRLLCGPCPRSVSHPYPRRQPSAHRLPVLGRSPTTTINSYDRRFTMKIALLLLVPTVVRADKVCITSDSGTTICQTKLTRGIIAAIACTVALLLLLILGAVAFLLYRRRQFTRAQANIAANAYVIEASQMQGPATFTTYAAPYGSNEVPSSAAKTAPTTYAGATYPFPGFASPKGTLLQSPSIRV
ncbi:hypothetical protein B0H16DRAFT_1902505 [Mycena metata]|uniref:Uncharacterized protein n=1 Tax=Mycena metata TaxID=1033252 RepID=A0AAD7DXF4_9AGAR|nr:hypothetical protein B0H16DRAFT_1902505 [Mycena metata]